MEDKVKVVWYAEECAGMLYVSISRFLSKSKILFFTGPHNANLALRTETERKAPWGKRQQYRLKATGRSVCVPVAFYDRRCCGLLCNCHLHLRKRGGNCAAVKILLLLRLDSTWQRKQKSEDKFWRSSDAGMYSGSEQRSGHGATDGQTVLFIPY